MLSGLEIQLLQQGGIKVEHAGTPETVREAQALRYRVFCLERGTFAVTPGQTIDCDEFDHRAQHVLLRRCGDREVVGTARVVPGSVERGANCLPLQRYCTPSIFRGVDMGSIGEISRFAISKQARGEGGQSGALLRLGLLRGILQASQDIGLTHWCALMEPSLLRLLQATGVHFAHLGDLVQAYGWRRPCIARIDLTLARGKRARPDFYDLIAGGVAASFAEERQTRPVSGRVA